MPRLLSFIAAFFMIVGIFAAPAAADDMAACGSNETSDAAVAACTRVIGSKKFRGADLAGVYVRRGYHFNNKSEYDRAIADLSEALRLDPKRPAAYHNRGWSHDRKGDYQRAIADYGEAIRLNPKYAVAYNNRGLAYRNKGEYDSAIADLSEAIRLDPKAAVAYANRGLSYTSKDDYARAIADFGEAIRLNPQYAGALYHRGRAYELKGDFSNAVVDYRAAFALGRQDKYASEAVRRMEQKLAARAEPKPPAAKPAQPPPSASAQAETRIALVIGNSAYANFGRLANPSNDAKAIEAMLKRIGFTTVALQLDLPREKLIDALKTFSREAERADWALIYFAGHGLELGGINYLVPVDAKLAFDREASYEAVELEKVLDAVNGARKLGLVILDACRDNPFAKSMTRSMASTRSIGVGLARIEPEGATLVAYAAKHGQVAQDGEGGNSPFVAALIKNLEIPEIEIGLLFRKVRDDVLAMTGRRQEPFIYGSLPSEAFYFRRP